ncbi:hypothetical protein D3C81_2006520 [compost metagenome]
MQFGVELRARFVQVNILIPDVFLAQRIDRIVQNTQITHGGISANIGRFKIKARQTQIEREAAQHRPDRRR